MSTKNTMRYNSSRNSKNEAFNRGLQIFVQNTLNIKNMVNTLLEPKEEIRDVKIPLVSHTNILHSILFGVLVTVTNRALLHVERNYETCPVEQNGDRTMKQWL